MRAAVGAYAAALVALAAGPAPRLAAEFTAWYTRAEDDRKYQRNVGAHTVQLTLNLTWSVVRHNVCPVSCRQDPAPPHFCVPWAVHRVCSASAVGMLVV